MTPEAVAFRRKQLTELEAKLQLLKNPPVLNSEAAGPKKPNE
jgi:hypothetical protein